MEFRISPTLLDTTCLLCGMPHRQGQDVIKAAWRPEDPTDTRRPICLPCGRNIAAAVDARDHALTPKETP